MSNDNANNKNSKTVIEVNRQKWDGQYSKLTITEHQNAPMTQFCVPVKLTVPVDDVKPEAGSPT